MASSIGMREVQISQRKLRFLQLHRSNTVSLGFQVPQGGMPLFLGADVLSGCSLAVSNFPRMHAKFSKSGLAVKVNFPHSVRLLGVHGTGRGIWFYSVQGLFRVCFEYYSREEQSECLTQFCTTWKLRFSDPPLPREIGLDVRDTLPIDSQSFAVPDSRQNTSSKSDVSCNQSTYPRRNEPNSNEVPTASRYCLRSRSSPCEPGGCMCITPTGKQFIDEILNLYNNDEIGDCDSFVMTTMRMMKEFKVQKSSKFKGMSRILIAASSWLGEEFNKLRNEIEERATDFKKRHITSIDCLPPARAVVEELFPECMQIFLFRWMGSEDRQSHIHSLIQVILELANLTLISGVAHVLYSRLIRTDTV